MRPFSNSLGVRTSSENRTVVGGLELSHFLGGKNGYFDVCG